MHDGHAATLENVFLKIHQTNKNDLCPLGGDIIQR